MVSEQDSGFYLFVHSLSEILLNLLSLISDMARSKWFFLKQALRKPWELLRPEASQKLS